MHEDKLLFWIQERDRIRIQREAGAPPPWTNDPVLASYRFCNVRREDDKVTRWIKEHIREPYAKAPNLPVMLALARWFNLPETLQHLMDAGVWVAPNGHINYTAITRQLALRRARGLKLWNNAYMIRAESNHSVSWFLWPKYQYVVEIVVKSSSSLIGIPVEQPGPHFQATWEWLKALYGWGEFMAFQVAVDLRHTPYLAQATDLTTFMAFGPGTRRGLNRLADRPLEHTVRREALENEVRGIQSMLQYKIGLYLEPYDICNVMCEFDKYLRGGGKQRYIPKES